MRLYNTLTKKTEEFKPIKEKEVKLYHCGPTVYWTQHIGNLRGMFCADLAVRTFKYLRYKVKHIRNYTDVGHLTSDTDIGEDKMEKGARREGLNPAEIAKKYIKIFEQDTQELNMLEPTVKPKATEHIQDMIEMTKTLIAKKYAYTTPLAIYFDISKVKNYTKLSGQILEENIQGAGKSDISDSQKKHSSDFALWFFKAGTHKNAIQYWTSPFSSKLVENGEGFPGWHIECSAMSKKYLGDTLDIHMGGVEHIPVHHTNEIAQSESANGVPFSNYWLHNEHLLVDNKKMAKSEGTSFSLQEIKEKGFNSLSLRYLFLTASYRSKLNFTWKSLEANQNTLNKLYDFIKITDSAITKNKTREQSHSAQTIETYKKQFQNALENNFDTPKALALIWEIIKSEEVNYNDKKTALLEFDKVLGLNLNKIKKEKIEISDDVKKLIEQREKARKNKDWEKADKLRNEIEKKGLAIKDKSVE
ncbi:MAG: cysteine--tRNA ligase [Patescibacteria group bacterium]|nr:cysteine--tRNA ligase [Patescibacteria group bacterium]